MKRNGKSLLKLDSHINVKRILTCSLRNGEIKQDPTSMSVPQKKNIYFEHSSQLISQSRGTVLLDRANETLIKIIADI